MTCIPLWVVCDGVAHGPFSFLAAYDMQLALRPAAIDRSRDTAMIHALTADDALQAVADGGSWYPRVD